MIRFGGRDQTPKIHFQLTSAAAAAAATSTAAATLSAGVVAIAGVAVGLAVAVSRARLRRSALVGLSLLTSRCALRRLILELPHRSPAETTARKLANVMLISDEKVLSTASPKPIRLAARRV